ncbi:MAG: ABC transporter ATP-binding protein [Gammaproteobacteria bacterium]
MNAPLVAIRNLSVGFASPQGLVRALRGVDLDIPRGRIVGVVGESGSGKSTLALALLGLLAANTARCDGQILFDAMDLFGLTEAERRRLRGARMAMIFQDPLSALNPLFSIATQLGDVLRRRRPGLSRRERRRRAAAMLSRVGIADAALRLADYPHQLSGGMRQRVLIAMALLAEPDLLIADEPTTALDATIEAQIVNMFKELRNDFQGSMLFISHSLGLVAELCDEVAVLYAGKIMESGPVGKVFSRPRHPYTAALLACEQDLSTGANGALAMISGAVPDPLRPAATCVFAPRCPRAAPVCQRAPPLREVAPSQYTACWLE